MNLRAGITKKINDLLEDETSIFWLVGLLFFGFLVFLLFSFSSEPKTLANWSSVGASFGALSALFTGLAFAGLIVTIVQQKRQLGMQSDELKLQRKELKATRKVLKKQNKEFRLQSETMKRQQFENIFFKLIDFYQANKKNISFLHIDPINGSEKKFYGEEAIEIALDELNIYLKKEVCKINNPEKIWSVAQGIADGNRENDNLALIIYDLQEYLFISLKKIILIIGYLEKNYPYDDAYQE